MLFLCLAAAGAGALATLAQLILIRELSLIFIGNEIFLGLALAAWLAGTAWGAGWWAQRLRAPDQYPHAWPWLAVVSGIALVLSLALIHGSRTCLAAPPGLELGPGAMLVIIAVAVMPVAALGGIAFAWLLSVPVASTCQPPSPGLLFACETLGAGAAGLLFSFWLVWHYQPWRLAGSLLVFYVCLAGCLWLRRQKWLSLLALALGVALVLVQPWHWAGHALPGRQPGPGSLRSMAYTPQGQATLYQDHDTFHAYYFNRRVFSVPNTLEAESLAILPWLACPVPANIAFLGSNPETMHAFLAQSGVEHLTVFEKDPAAQLAWQRGLPEAWRQIFCNPRLRRLAGDPRRWLRQEPACYDLMVLDAQLPITLAENRFYTFDFFQELRRRIRKSGLLVYSFQYSSNRLPDSEARFFSSVWQAIGKAFKHRQLWAGDRLWLLASEDLALETLTPADLSLGFAERRPAVSALTSQQLSWLLDPGRSAWMRRLLFQQPAAVNRDSRPMAALWHSWYWLSEHASLSEALVLGLLGWLVIYALRYLLTARTWEFVLLGAAGNAGIMLELFILSGFQCTQGSLWQELGVLVAAYMAGSGLGSLVGTRLSRRMAWLRMLAVFLAVLSAVAYPWFILSQGGLLLASSLLALAGFAAGALFTLAAPSASFQKARQAWAADAAGAVIGALIANTLLLPGLGIWSGLVPAACLLLAMLRTANRQAS